MYFKKRVSVILAMGMAAGLMAAPKRAIELDVPRDQVIAAALYTVHGNTLKLQAQLFPLKPGEDRNVRLELKQAGKWTDAARVKVCENEYGNASGDQSWTALFRIENWDDTRDVPYRVRHGKKALFEGLVRKNPVDKEEIVVAGFTGNSIKPGHGGDISRQDLVDNVKAADADLLFFSGDQVYDHKKHYEYWVKFCLDFAEVMKDRPTVSIPDDHDVGQPNLWGQDGKISTAKGAVDGGYAMPASYVREVERAQTANLPDPFDPTPIEQGIGTYYTELNWGRISFAILEDRKFKSGPNEVRVVENGRADHVPNAAFDVTSIDKPGLKLLGDRQLAFLDQWGQDWDGADFKVALSQTIFCGGAHIHGKVGGRLYGDLDSNGWPQTGRNRAVDALRKAYAFHYAGDQHLATVFQHGVEEQGDAMYSFCVPSIANLYLRWWEPLEAGGNRTPGQDPIFGEHKDTFGNRVICHAVANPAKEPNGGDKLTTRAAGFGIVRFNKASRKITMECWPRNVELNAPGAKPYPGWPITIAQTDNYGRKAAAYLPTIKVKGKTDPVIKVIDESTGEWVYALRIKGDTFQPKVFKKGTYTVEVDGKSIKGLKAEGLENKAVLEVASTGRPNILFCIMDDATWMHMGAYGCEWAETPAFDRLAEQGILFQNAYTPNAKCAPSRSSILTGRNSWQLEEAANHVVNFPAQFKTFPEALREHGYTTGKTGKGWGPGDPGLIDGRKRELIGPAISTHKKKPPAKGMSGEDYAANFDEFLDASGEQSWFFWYGAREPHRRYEYGSAAKAGKKIESIDQVPGFWPDNEIIRNDMLDYVFEIEHADRHLGRMIQSLEKRGLLENTIILMTSDNGMPFPRCKAQEYEYSNHMPLAVMWPKGIKKPGRTVDDMVSFIDFAPTFMEAAGIPYEKSGMKSSPGISLFDIFLSEKAGQVNPQRDFVLIGKERHDYSRPKNAGFPIRGIVGKDHLYLYNYELDRWPTGNPELGYLDCDGSPTKTEILNLRRQGKNDLFWNMSFGKRAVHEELFNIGNDRECMDNLAQVEEAGALKREMRDRMEHWLKTQDDPRMAGEGAVFDTYGYSQPHGWNFYERFMAGEFTPKQTGWVNPSDYESQPLD